jgi:hypothetical protein
MYWLMRKGRPDHVAINGHVDQVKPLAIDLAQDVVEQGPELRRQGLLPSPMAQGDKDAVTTDRQRGLISPLGRVRLFEPVHHPRFQRASPQSSDALRVGDRAVPQIAHETAPRRRSRASHDARPRS